MRKLTLLPAATLLAVSTVSFASEYNGNYNLACTGDATYQISIDAGIGEITHTPEKVLLDGTTFQDRLEVPITCEDNTLIYEPHNLAEEVKATCEQHIADSEQDLSWVNCDAISDAIADVSVGAIEKAQNQMATDVTLDVKGSTNWFLRLLGLQKVVYYGTTVDGTDFEGKNMYIDKAGKWFVNSLKVSGAGFATPNNAAFCVGPKSLSAKGSIEVSPAGNTLLSEFKSKRNITCGAIIDGAYLAGFSVSAKVVVDQEGSEI